MASHVLEPVTARHYLGCITSMTFGSQDYAQTDAIVHVCHSKGPSAALEAGGPERFSAAGLSLSRYRFSRTKTRPLAAFEQAQSGRKSPRATLHR